MTRHSSVKQDHVGCACTSSIGSRLMGSGNKVEDALRVVMRFSIRDALVKEINRSFSIRG
jgi:hypothetical protein